MKSKPFFSAMMSKCVLWCAAVLALLLGCAGTSWAQSTGGRIRGTVTDATGGAVVGAKLSISNPANGLQRETETGGTGEYIFLEVPVGQYDIALNQPGFKKYLRKGVVLNLNEVLTVDIVLQVGGSTETVEVTGAPPL